MQRDEYDLAEALRQIENELIASIIRNLRRHRAEETEAGYDWSMWQTEQLKALEKYKAENQKKYRKQFKTINEQIKALITMFRSEGEMEQELAILEAIRDGFQGKRVSKGATAEFFKLNDRKLDALIEATVNDMEKAETAVLRMANDQYRKVIYNAQVYANTGAGTYEKAVDMATRDFLAAGLNCIEYANGSRHTISDYADMAIRTASKRAYLQGEGTKRQEWGVSTVIINKRGDNPCPKCLPFVGKVMIDDVWSGGQADGKSPVTGIKYPRISDAIAAGLYHPRCRDSHTTYFEGISTPPDGTFSKKELNEIAKKNQQEARRQYAERQEEKYGRLAEYSLDQENLQRYKLKCKEWSNVRAHTDNTEQQEQLFRASKNITTSWASKSNNPGTVSDLLEYVFGENTYKIDGRNVVLDYSVHERNVAENIAKKYGKEIQMVPRVLYPQGISTPDFRIDGIGWDLKTISTAGKNVFYNAVKKKKRQAGCFIFDITDCPLEIKEIKQQVTDLFRSTHLTFIDQIALYKEDEIIGVYKKIKNKSHSLVQSFRIMGTRDDSYL